MDAQKPTGVSNRQTEIFVNGMSGRKPKIDLRLDHLKEQARSHVSPERFGYIEGGAGKENTLHKNKEAFQKWAIVPRILTDITNVNPEIELFGRKYAYPFLLAPVGLLSHAHKEGERAVARAASKENITMVFSTQASNAMEVVSEQMGTGDRWYQLYWSKSEEFNHSLIKRAEACGCSALVITVDTKLAGWRTKDLNSGYFAFEGMAGLAQYMSDPVFQGLVDDYIKSGRKGLQPKVNFTLLKFLINLTKGHPGSFFKNLITLRAVKALAVMSEIFSQPSLTWNDIKGLRKITNLPIIIKGVLHPDDAKLALKHGLDGIVVSNHGGRQLSGCIASLDALPAIADVIKGKIPILLDSGVRGGADIFKALALGANAVLIGRPYVYALAIAGEDGVRELIQNLKAEFDLTMALSGCVKVSEINKDLIVRS